MAEGGFGVRLQTIAVNCPSPHRVYSESEVYSVFCPMESKLFLLEGKRPWCEAHPLLAKVNACSTFATPCAFLGWCAFKSTGRHQYKGAIFIVLGGDS